ncbi:arginine--tRNA ligase [Flavobacterium sp.]|uniref:arginine--tRNA ligase n=1 Tax=Flavobacterium sp. TaxID=239 RepID=UPI0026392E57|nr:arginine--tRNA ligase [Flavobacterium sp.]MDD3005345.1 arginine--tRNA ligase [Flavobacterium sp.]
MSLISILTPEIKKALTLLFDVTIDTIEFQATRREFEGDITMVIFPLLKVVKGNPVELGNKIGTYIVENVAEVQAYNVVSGFLNIVISADYYLNFFNEVKNNFKFGIVEPNPNDKAVMVEYSSPNTNKPLHLGHVRNNLLGYSVAEIIKASGKKVYKTQIINDRGIHICKSMLAWQKFGNGETPESTGLKGDKIVGNYYVKFDQEYKNQINDLKEKGLTEDEAKKQAPIILEAQQMLLDWEAGKPEVIELWKTMNQWVYDGFATTYKNMGVDFDSYYYESNTYLLGKEVVQMGLEKGVFEKDPDGSVWIDLTEEGLDRKIVLRSDGTAVYMTQDIGTAIQRVKDFPDVGGLVYTVGNEQDYHFKVLFLILKKLGFDWSENLFHLSYGMVDLPSGKMKSREGTVVDADDLMQEMTQTAQTIAEDLGKLDGYSDQEKAELYKIIGLGALKYYILKVDPKKRILFNPEESVDFAGNTGPFIQYTYARIQSIIRKANFDFASKTFTSIHITLHEKEKELIKVLALYPEVIQNAAQNHSPALIANYTYDLVKEYNSFYQSVPILGSEDENAKMFRVQLSKKVGETIASAFQLLGISVPNRM